MNEPQYIVIDESNVISFQKELNAQYQNGYGLISCGVTSSRAYDNIWWAIMQKKPVYHPVSMTCDARIVPFSEVTQ